MRSAIDDQLVGRVLEGRYRVLARLAHGGMSTVYAGLDLRLERDIAVKVMAPELSRDPAFADRFAREARVVARLSHPNVVTVHDQGAEDGLVFLVMELVTGRTLRELLVQRGALSPALAVSIMQPVLAALAAAHRAGLAHRDIKPENILLSDDGAVKVADFGLARAVEADLSSTRTGLMMGTVAYSSPEHISRGFADARSDVYSAGIVFYELLTGQVPYVGDNPMTVAYQHVHADVGLPSAKHAGIPSGLDELVRRSTSREPSARPLDAGAMLAELHDVRSDAGLPVLAVPPRPAPDWARSARRGPDWAGSARPGPDRTEGGTERLRAHDWTVAATAVPTQRLNVPRATAALPQQAAATSALPQQAAATVAAPRPPEMGRHSGHRGASAAASAAPIPAGIPAKIPRRRRRRRGLLVLLLVLLLGIGTGFGAWWFAVGRYSRLPSVVGISRDQAITTLRADGFQVSTADGAVYSEDYAADSVAATQPQPDSRLERGKTVTLTLSKGPERYLVPAVAAAAYPQASASIAALPLHPVRSDVSDDKVPAGQVIRTDPAGGQQVKNGTVVTVYVSTGPPVLGVPDVHGGSTATATATLKKTFAVTVAEEFSDTVPSGVVIRTSPVAGAPAVKFSTVTIVTSKGRQFVTVPQIAENADADDVSAMLNNLGLVVTITKKHRSILDFSSYHNQVYDVSPPAGTVVQVGSTVNLSAQ